MYVKPLSEAVKRFGLQYHHYVDNPQFSLMLPSDFKGAVQILNQHLEMMGWMRTSKLLLKPDKTDMLLVSSNSQFEDMRYQCCQWGHGSPPPPADGQSFLGILVAAVAKIAHDQLLLIGLLCSLFNQRHLATVIHALLVVLL